MSEHLEGVEDPTPNRFAAPAADIGRQNTNYFAAKRNCFFIAMASAVALGAAAGLATAELTTPIWMLDTFVFRAIVVFWALYDAGQRKYQHGELYLPLTLVAPGPMIMIPYYLLRSRPSPYGALWTLAAFVLFLGRLVLFVSSAVFVADLNGQR